MTDVSVLLFRVGAAAVVGVDLSVVTEVPGLAGDANVVDVSAYLT